MFVIVLFKKLVALGLECLDFVPQVGLRMNDLFAKMRVWLFNAESFGDFVHQLFFILPVHAFDLWEFQRFLTQFEDGHLLQVFPFHKILRSHVRVVECVADVYHKRQADTKTQL